jgi:YVTN family beta-propeller protein
VGTTTEGDEPATGSTASRAPDPRLGSTLAGYRITSLLGRGGMSVVYLAEDVGLRRRVAIKLIAPELAEDRSFRERFVRESRLAASLEHPGIVPIYGAGEHEGVLYIAMRYVEGTDLRALLEARGPLEPREAIPILRQVATALDAAHDRGLIHRDVKPGNILLDRADPPHAYLTDFGLTRLTTSRSSLTSTDQFLGTVDYAAPEQIEGHELDGRADQYGLACVAFECLTGSPPFGERDPMAVLWAHVYQQPSAPSSVRPELPTEMDAPVVKAMAKSKENRFASCEAFVGALEPAARAMRERADATPDGRGGPATAPPAGRGPRRPGRASVVVAVLAALAVVAAAVLITRGGGARAPGSSSPAETGPSPSVASTASTSPIAKPGFVGVGRMDPKTGRVLQGFPLALRIGSPEAGPGGGLMVAGEGALWALSGGNSLLPLLEVDPSSGKVLHSITLATTVPGGTVVQKYSFTVGDGSLWVAVDTPIADTPLQSDVLRIDPASGVVQRFRTGSGDAGIAVGAGAVWVAHADGALSRIDLGTKKITRRFASVGTDASAVTVNGNTVWVAETLAGEVVSVDATTHHVSRPILLTGGADQIVAAKGAIWVLDTKLGNVYVIDETTRQVIDTVRVGALPRSMARGPGAVWTANGGDGTVTRIDVSSRAKQTFPTGESPGSGPCCVAVGLGSVWVAAGTGNAF